MKNFLVVGGAGYIGSNVTSLLCEKGYKVVIIDNLINSYYETISKLKQKYKESIDFLNIDVTNNNLKKILEPYDEFDGVYIFFALKSIPQSILDSDLYYRNNVWGLINLFNALEGINIKKIIFSSSASVYSEVVSTPFKETSHTEPKNPYAWSKLICENYVRQWSFNNKVFSFNLRYFNPVGSSENYIFGDMGKSSDKNLFPILCESALNKKNIVKIFGNNYPTQDGTCMRDYIHITCLSEAHLAVLKAKPKSFFNTFNIGTGKATSVIEIIKTFEKINNVSFITKNYPRRNGDLAISFASPEKANSTLGWKTKRSLEEMCYSAFQFYKLNIKK